MGRLKPLLSAIIAVVLLLSGCNNSDVNNETQSVPANNSDFQTQKASVTLPYASTDSLDPFKVKTKSNGEIVRLLFDSLIMLNQNFEPENIIAEKIELTDTSCLITLKKNAKFTDNTSVTAQDVVYSLNLAINASELYYSKNLSNVASYSVTDKGAVNINLKHADDYFINFLDFPIIKANSDGKKNKDNKDVPPIGTGRYVFSQNSGEYLLTRNENWFLGKVNTKYIKLMNLPDQDAVDHALRSGKLSIYYSDLSDNMFPSISGKSMFVPMNNLVYLGIGSSASLSDTSVRKAISCALDRSEIVKSAYFNAAVSAKGIYHSNFDDAKGFQTFSEFVDEEGVTLALKEAGYTKNESTGFYTKNGNKLKLSLVYNLSNSARGLVADLIIKQLSKYGIEVVKQGLDSADYKSAIRYGNCDLFIAEVKIPANMNPLSLLTNGGITNVTLSSGVVIDSSAENSQNVSSVVNESSYSDSSNSDESSSEVDTENIISAAQAAYNMQIGIGTLSETVSCFNEQLPIIPICHRSGVLVYKDITDGISPLSYDPLNGIQNVFSS